MYMKRTITAVCAAFLAAASMAGTVIADDGIMISVTTSDGETGSVTAAIAKSEEGDRKVSVNVTLPASVAGEETLYTIPDIVRVVDGNTYINMETVTASVQEMSGGMDLSGVLELVGIREPWIVIPALEIPTEEEAPELSDEFFEELKSCFEPIELVKTDAGYSVSFDKENLTAVWTNLRTLEREQEQAWNAAFGLPFERSNCKTVFADYILAAAEGMNAANPELPVEDGVEMLHGLLDLLIDAADGEMAVIQSEDGETVFGLVGVTGAENADLTAEVSINRIETGVSVMIQAVLTSAEEQVNLDVIAAFDSAAVQGDVEVPQETVLLRDVVKAGAELVYQTWMMDGETP